MEKPTFRVYFFIFFFACLEFFEHLIGWKAFGILAVSALLADQIELLWERVRQLESKFLK